jgi:type I restriction enzyme R subunit
VLSNAVAEALGTYRAIPAGKTFGVVNTSSRIVLMIDEAHRTQSSDLGDNLFEAFPNATRLAFTGTPLITDRHAERKTVKRFGDYIDKYRLLDAVNDGATLQILYEGRTADSALAEKHAFDEKFEDLFRDRSDEELAAIRKKYGATGDILEAKARIDAISRDLVRHYVGRVEMWRGGGRSRHRCFRPFRLAVPYEPDRGSVSTSPSSNRTCATNASGSLPTHQAFAFERSRAAGIRRISLNFS